MNQRVVDKKLRISRNALLESCQSFKERFGSTKMSPEKAEAQNGMETGQNIKS